MTTKLLAIFFFIILLTSCDNTPTNNKDISAHILRMNICDYVKEYQKNDLKSTSMNWLIDADNKMCFLEQTGYDRVLTKIDCAIVQKCLK